MKPYEGDEPYIFVSYSHQDAPIVFPIIERLNAAGFRIWYDEGIEWGSIWTEELIKHINNCNVVMVFLSGNAVNSPHCQNEILYANSVCKTFFTIYFEPVPLPQHLYAIFQSIQAALLYEYSFEQFIERLCDAEVLQPSRGKSSAQWYLERGEKYFKDKNYPKAFEYLRKAADSTNLVTSTIAAQLIKEILSESRAFKKNSSASKDKPAHK